MYLYFTSCNFTQASPDTSKRIRKYLENAHGIESTGCCRPGHKKLGAGDTALTICHSCAAIIRENAAADEQSIFEFLDMDEAFPWPDYHEEVITLQDCWRARGKHELHDAVRRILEKMNMKVQELEESRENCQYCGVFRHNPMAEKNIRIAPHYFVEQMEGQLELCTQEEQQQLMTENARRYQTDRVVVYCNSCLRGLRQAGVNGIHLMDLMFP